MLYMDNDTIVFTGDTSTDFVNRAIHHLNPTPLKSNIIAEIIEYDDGSFDVILNKEVLDLEPFLSQDSQCGVREQ